jgi:hypothetical protein
VSTPIGTLKNNYNEILSDPLFLMLPEAKITQKDINTIIEDLSETSKAFSKFKEYYYKSASDSLLRKIASEIEKIIETGKIPEDVPGTGRRRLSEASEELLSFTDLSNAIQDEPLISELLSEILSLMNAKPSDLYDLWSNLNFIGEVKESMNVGPIYENATIKRNEELYQAEINKDDYLLFVDLLNLVSNKPIFGQIISEFQLISSRGINEDDHPMISKVFAEVDDVFAPDLSETTNFEDLYIELMYQETFT